MHGVALGGDTRESGSRARFSLVWRRRVVESARYGWKHPIATRHGERSQEFIEHVDQSVGDSQRRPDVVVAKRHGDILFSRRVRVDVDVCEFCCRRTARDAPRGRRVSSVVVDGGY